MKLKFSFLLCSNCNVWGDIPDNFKETKHFGKCPKCHQSMYLTRGVNPKDLAFSDKNKVLCEIMLHGAKL